ncbi:MAG: zf-HC2 domain-containing protein [Granulosicoccaceae bacterium]
MTSDSTTHSDHKELMLKLPWLLNGSLTGSEAASMQEHVAQCDHCQNEIISLKLMNKTITDASVDTGNAAASFSKMRQRITAEPSRPVRSSVSRFMATIGQWLPAAPAPQWLVASIGGILLAFVLMLQTDMMGSSTDDSYRVLSSNTGVNSVSVAVSFDKAVIDAQAEAALMTISTQIAPESKWVKAGPGSYLLSITGDTDDSIISPEGLNKLINELRGIPDVIAVSIAP